MKKQVKGITARFLAVLMVMTMFSSVAFAADNKTVQIKGYEGEEKAQLEITNIVSTTDKVDDFTISTVDYDEEIYTFTSEYMDAQVTANTPATVATLDDGCIFAVYKLQSDGDNYTYDDTSIQPYSSGKIQISDPDGKISSVDINELPAYDSGYSFYNMLPGCTVTLTEPGVYYAIFRYEAVADAAEVIIEVKGSTVSTPTATATAKPTASKVLVNGASISFDAYNINGNNYFKLRDLAKVVSGTAKQFDVSWDGTMNAINLISGTAYTVAGGELAVGDGKTKTGTLSTATIYKDGEVVALTAYSINGNNYFKLRDIASIFNIGVTYDTATSTVVVDTSVGYTD